MSQATGKLFVYDGSIPESKGSTKRKCVVIKDFLPSPWVIVTGPIGKRTSPVSNYSHEEDPMMSAVHMNVKPSPGAIRQSKDGDSAQDIGNSESDTAYGCRIFIMCMSRTTCIRNDRLEQSRSEWTGISIVGRMIAFSLEAN